jgi:hypothetical protein
VKIFFIEEPGMRNFFETCHRNARFVVLTPTLLKLRRVDEFRRNIVPHLQGQAIPLGLHVLEDLNIQEYMH